MKDGPYYTGDVIRMHDDAEEEDPWLASYDCSSAGFVLPLSPLPALFPLLPSSSSSVDSQKVGR